MITIIILIIIGIVVFYFLRDRDKMLDVQVDNQGGMLIKYKTLIDWLTSEPRSKIVKAARDHVQISCIMPTTATHFLITETFSGVEVDWSAQFGKMGNHKLNWIFSKDISDEDMIIRIGTDLKDYEDKLYG